MRSGSTVGTVNIKTLEGVEVFLEWGGQGFRVFVLNNVLLIQNYSLACGALSDFGTQSFNYYLKSIETLHLSMSDSKSWWAAVVLICLTSKQMIVVELS